MGSGVKCRVLGLGLGLRHLYLLGEDLVSDQSWAKSKFA